MALPAGTAPVHSVVDNAASEFAGPDLSVVVVSYNTAHLLKRMFAALYDAAGSIRMEVIVIDNASSDDSVDILEHDYPDVRVIKNKANVGFGRANNQAIPYLRGRYILLLNTDAFVEKDTLAKTISYLDDHPSYGILGVKLVGEDGSLQPSCRYFPTPWNVFLQRTGLSRFFPRHRLVDDMSWDHASVRPCDWVPGCYYLIRGEALNQCGLFDPRFFLYYEEVDHCRTVKSAGWEVLYYPFTEVVHLGGESAKTSSSFTKVGRQISALQIESELLYFRKYYGVFGLLAGILLSITADLLTAMNGLLRRFDLQGARNAWQHVTTVLRIVGATRFAAQPTK
jgi:N-acetylglucosaminyl-diphospho-decaprenol L-rhamnosyltransferase